MAATGCTSCGAPAPLAGTDCHYCGAAPAGESDEELDRSQIEEADAAEPSAETVVEVPPADLPAADVPPADLPPAHEARRVRGLLVPLVAGALVVGVGYPLTALAVSQVGGDPPPAGEALPPQERSASGPNPGPGPSAPARPTGARLSGAVTYDGPVRAIQCDGGMPVLLIAGEGPDRYSIRLGIPPGTGTTSAPLHADVTFVAVTQLASGGRTWTSRQRPDASGEVTVRPDRSVSASFRGLAPMRGAEGTVDGTVEARCG